MGKGRVFPNPGPKLDRGPPSGGRITARRDRRGPGRGDLGAGAVRQLDQVAQARVLRVASQPLHFDYLVVQWVVWMGHADQSAIPRTRWVSFVDCYPVNLTDPSGSKPWCPPGEEEDCNNMSFVSYRGFSYLRSNRPPQKLYVDYSQYPWNTYTDKTKTPHTLVRIPIRHPLNLYIKFWQCLDANDQVNSIKQLYMTNNFYNWEVNARNIIGEMKGIFNRGEETALRDSIGIAYNPYNQVAWNRYAHSGINSSIKSLDYDPFHNEIKENYYDFKAVLISGTQFAVGASTQTIFAGAAIGSPRVSQNIYEVALIIAYGVDKRYFRDTSFGATEFRQRPDEYSDLGISGPTFFYKNPIVAGIRRYARTSEQLWAQQGWDY